MPTVLSLGTSQALLPKSLSNAGMELYKGVTRVCLLVETGGDCSSDERGCKGGSDAKEGKKGKGKGQEKRKPKKMAGGVG